jgi:class 3 adenylate cyclase/tetratricopeptide (TPR) repeat protein
MTSTSTVTILFTDVVGSTALTQRLGDAEAQEVLLNTHNTIVRNALKSHDGSEIKHTGDGIMASFSSATSALKCAISMQEALAVHNEASEEQIGVRIGLNTGEAIEKEGDFFGMAVVAAARVMSKAAGGQILIPENTRDAIGEGKDISLLDRGPFWLKGFPERWRLYEVLWHKDKISTAVVLPHIGKRTPFVGRESERADLRRYLDAARDGHGSLVMIGGEPGVGKTRITQELVVEARQHGFLTLTGHCYEMEGAPPYIPFVEIIESAARIVEPTALLSAMGESAPEVAKLTPELRHKFRDIPTPPQLPPDQERRRMFNGVLDFISQASRQQPLLLVIEDLHWTDEPTLLLLQHIVQQLHEMPVLMVGTYRDTELDVARSLASALKELLRQRLAHDLLLKPLPSTEVSAMLQGRSGYEPTARLVAAIYEETEGNPFFVEEIFKHLAEEGKLFDADGQWHSDLRIDELDVPRGVLLVIGHRLERITQECKHTLATAAVIGRIFGFRLLEELTDLHDDAVFDAIDEAERAQLIRSTTKGGEAQIMFAHELIRQTLLSDLSTPRRQRLHLRVAEAIAQIYEDNLQEHAADLAYHFYQGDGDSEKIIEYAVLAAERATAQTAYEEAVAQYERAIQILERRHPVDQLRRCNLLLALGRAYGNAGDPEHAKERLLGVTDIARKIPAPEQFAEALLEMCRFLAATGIPADQLIKLMDECLELLGEEDSALRASLMGRMPYMLSFFPNERSVALSREAEAMARRVGDPNALYYALEGRGHVWDIPLEEKIAAAAELAELEEKTGASEGLWRGLYFLARHNLSRGDIVASDAALAAYKGRAAETQHPSMLYYATVIESTRAQMMGRLEEAERLALESLALGQKFNKVVAADNTAIFMYVIRLLQGRLDEIDEALRSHWEQYPGVPIFRSALSCLHLYMGRKEEAREEFEHLAQNDFGSVARIFTMPIILMQMGEVAAALGDTRRAALLYKMLHSVAECLLAIAGHVTCFGSKAHWLGLLAGTMKKWDDAVEHFEDAIKTNTRVGARPYHARSQHEFARMLIERNESRDEDKAKALLTEATATYRELGMPTFLEDAEELLVTL